MSRELNMAGDKMWEAITPEAREDWSVHAASNDPLTRDVLALFMKWELDDQATRDVCLDALEEHIVVKYSLPRHRCDEVFHKVETVIREKAAGDGQA